MSQSKQAFYEFLLGRPDLQQQLQGGSDWPTVISLAVQLGKDNGFSVTKADIEGLLAEGAEGELTDEELNQISGSGGWGDCCDGGGGGL
ncbi:MAG: hypothetical protein AAF614_15720 [Chloroflexota bacterium]